MSKDCLIADDAEVKNKFTSLTGRRFPNWRENVDVSVYSNIVAFNPYIRLPIGPLFYPCSGSDIRHAIDIFGSGVSEFHFADPFHPFKRSLGRDKMAKHSDVVQILNIGNIVIHQGASRQLRVKEHKVISHQKDGVLTLLDDLTSIAVFYYRGDSQGEGGSGQNWMGSVLLDLVLSKMINGGLICSDGSNGCGNTFEVLMKLPIGQFVSYRNLRLCRLATSFPGIRNRQPMFIWQVLERN